MSTAPGRGSKQPEVKQYMDYSRVAHFYDRYVDVTIDVPFFLKEAQPISGEVLELTAGTGRVSIPLIEAGVRLTCVDNSAEMLAVLRQKLETRGLTADVREMDMRALALGKSFELIFIPFHAFAELTAEADQRAALAGIHAHLSESGRFICTLHNPPVRLRRVDGQLRVWRTYPVEEGLGIMLGAEQYNPETHLVQGLQFYEVYDADGFLQSKRVLETSFHLLEKERFQALAESAGFKVEALYGDYAYAAFDEATSPFMIWVLRP
jgi:SAM-dependent methyltransferase